MIDCKLDKEDTVLVGRVNNEGGEAGDSRVGAKVDEVEDSREDEEGTVGDD